MAESANTDNPRADLVALLLQFEACTDHRGSLYLSGDDAGAAVRAWCDLRGHRIEVSTHTRVTDRRTIAWTHYTVHVAGDLPGFTVTCALHDDHEVTSPPAQADQQVLARVRAALDGTPTACPECDGPVDHCADCGVPNGSPHAAFCHQQPEAVEGSV